MSLWTCGTDCTRCRTGDLEDRTDEAAHTDCSWRRSITGTPATSALASPVVKRDTTSWSGTSPVVNALREEFLEGSRDGGDIVVVSHGAAIRLVAAQLAGVPGLFAANNHLANTETVELLPSVDGGWECLRWGTVNPPFEHRLIPGADDVMG